MSKKLKLSPWHDGSVKPVHVGVYQRDWTVINRHLDFTYYAYFDGQEWMESAAEGCGINMQSPSIRQDCLPWRGILK